MGLLKRIFGKRDHEGELIDAAERMLVAKVDEANRLRTTMAARVTQLQNKLAETNSLLNRPDVKGIRRRQAKEDFDRTAKAIELSQKEAALLDQGLTEAEEARAKSRELIAGRTQANEADVMVKMKMLMDELDQKRQLTQLALSDLRSTSLSTTPVGPAAAVAEAEAPPTPAAPEVDEAAGAAERKRKMDELMGPMSV